MIESSEFQIDEHSNNEGEPSQVSQNEEISDSTGELKKRIQDLEAQLKEKDARYVYLYAEFENFKKRAIKERSDVQKFGWESLARELLQTIDNLERALSHIPLDTDQTLAEGIKMVLNHFKGALQKQGVQQIESLDKNFDPNLHEAVAQENSEHPAGVILKEHSKGYTLHGRLLRPAQVIVSDGQGSAKSS